MTRRQSLTSQMIDGVFPSSGKGDLASLVKRRRDAPTRTCLECYQVNYLAAKVCCGCFRVFYERRKRNDPD